MSEFDWTHALPVETGNNLFSNFWAIKTKVYKLTSQRLRNYVPGSSKLNFFENHSEKTERMRNWKDLLPQIIRFVVASLKTNFLICFFNLKVFITKFVKIRKAKFNPFFNKFDEIENAKIDHKDDTRKCSEVRYVLNDLTGCDEVHQVLIMTKLS